MANNVINKVVYGGRTLIDLTSDTAVEDKVLSGYSFHKADGTIAEGTSTFDADTKDATVQAAEMITGKTAYKNGAKVTGTMPNIGKQTGTISSKAQSVTISKGYHDGSGTVAISGTEQAKIVPGNIKIGVQLLGVTGTYDGGELIKATVGTTTPTVDGFTLLASAFGDYDYLTQVTVNPIPYSETQNAGGGYTATIA